MNFASGTWTDATGQAIARWYVEQVGVKLSTSYSAMAFFEGLNIVAAALFIDYNGHNVELCYYGKKTLTRDKIRFIGSYVFNQQKCSRLTIKIPRRFKSRGKILTRLGFIHEGTQKVYFGLTKDDDALVYGLTKDKIPKWIFKNGRFS